MAHDRREKRNVRRKSRRRQSHLAGRRLRKIFVAEKTFEGCGGLAITDEIKVTIAAQACLLLLHRETEYYPGPRVDPRLSGRVRGHDARQRAAASSSRTDQARLGESWIHGAVVLAWDAVAARRRRRSTTGTTSCCTSSRTSSTPKTARWTARPTSARGAHTRLGARARREYEELLEQRRRAQAAADIDPYGATNPAEFFAVVTETFFEKPAQMTQRHPELYAELATFYKQDPASKRLTLAARD